MYQTALLIVEQQFAFLSDGGVNLDAIFLRFNQLVDINQLSIQIGDGLGQLHGNHVVFHASLDIGTKGISRIDVFDVHIAVGSEYYFRGISVVGSSGGYITLQIVGDRRAHEIFHYAVGRCRDDGLFLSLQECKTHQTPYQKVNFLHDFGYFYR